MTPSKTSPLQEAYELLGATTPLEMFQKYCGAEQVLFKSREWDYEKPELLPNKVKVALERVKVTALTEEEKEWRDEVLWYWNHHAISVAAWKDNRRDAQKYAKKAVALQGPEHPNQITKLLYYLVFDRVADARDLASQIKEDPEKTAASELVVDYLEGRFLTQPAKATRSRVKGQGL